MVELRPTETAELAIRFETGPGIQKVSLTALRLRRCTTDAMAPTAVLKAHRRRWIIEPPVHASVAFVMFFALAGCGVGNPGDGTTTTEPPEICHDIPVFVENMAWAGNGKLVVAATDDHLVGSVSMLDPASGVLAEVARGAELGPLLPISASENEAVWAPTDRATIWVGGPGTAPQEAFETSFSAVEDLSWTSVGVVAAVVVDRSSARTQVVWLDAKGSVRDVVADRSNVISTEVWASRDGVWLVVASSPVPELDANGRQSVQVRSGALSRHIDLPDFGTHFSMTPSHEDLVFRGAASGDLIAYRLADGSQRRLASQVDVGEVSVDGTLAYARRIGPRRIAASASIGDHSRGVKNAAV